MSVYIVFTKGVHRTLDTTYTFTLNLVLSNYVNYVCIILRQTTVSWEIFIVSITTLKFL